ncbi:hypothetical protein [Oxynema aestuarii]|uniref:Uncharacterized protein n=1 Tax=Oxynema aestuarii AP17 TaxID=2064643 RepID=A0A6H1TXX0_9CYAN|nr:hypothetical protein [Oxynema aestuarii]QIZ71458.1 hypothetical protein HCG48_13430 [Oxynema aestuarii AP17]
MTKLYYPFIKINRLHQTAYYFTDRRRWRSPIAERLQNRIARSLETSNFCK